MDIITHEKNKDNKVIIKAEGDVQDQSYIFEAILTSKEDNNGEVHISSNTINTYGIKDPLLKEAIIKTTQKNKGIHGEPPLIFDKNE